MPAGSRLQAAAHDMQMSEILRGEEARIRREHPLRSQQTRERRPSQRHRAAGAESRRGDLLQAGGGRGPARCDRACAIPGGPRGKGVRLRHALHGGDQPGRHVLLGQCLEIEVASQGETVESALENLREALEVKLEDEPVVSPV
jgi:hypothetical protein